MFDVNQEGYQNNKLFCNLAEDIKTPLLQIINETQLLKISKKSKPENISIIAEAAVRLVDSYIISNQIYAGQQQFGFEPVSAAVVVRDTIGELNKLANLYNCCLTPSILKNSKLVMANHRVLFAALVSLTYGVMLSGYGQSSLHYIDLLIKKNKQNIELSVNSNAMKFSEGSLKKLRGLLGNAKQLAPELNHGSSAAIAVSDILFSALSTPLKVSKIGKVTKISAIFRPSCQLALL